MSYEPTIIINKKDLEKSLHILEEEQYSNYDETNEVAKYLLDVNSYETIRFGDLVLVICKPELTGFSVSIRNKLNDLNIEYQLDN